MKKTSFLFNSMAIVTISVLCLFGYKGISQITREYKNFNVEFNQAKNNSYNLQFTIEKFNISVKTIDAVSYSFLDFKGGISTSRKGYAELPIINASVQLPPDKNITMKVENGSYTDYYLDYPMLPSRGNIKRNQDPSTIPYEIDPASIVDQWYPIDIATSTDPYIIRDVRGINVYVYPIQYNAAKKILRVYNTVSVKLIENNSTPVNPIKNVKKVIEQEMFDTYKSIFINYNNTKANWAQETGENGELLVIYTSRDSSVIKPYIAWKKQMGYKVTKQLVATGTNVKTTIANAYTANNNILYVQLVGDWDNIKCNISSGTSPNGAPMDPMLGCVVGTDNYPDICIGRFSAGSATDVTTQVNKTVNYEKFPLAGGTWYKAALGIGSDEGSGAGDDGEMDHDHISNIWTGRLNPFTYTNISTAYDPGATAGMVSTAVSNGVSLINYCGHGDWDRFVTTGFNNSNVNNLTNGNKLPIIISVACLEGEFQLTSSPCFAEYWLRKTNGGAVATLMATVEQDWTQPMAGQDYMNDMLTGGYTYMNNTSHPGIGTNTDHGKTHFGSIVLNGDVLMYAEDNTALPTMQTWTIFGDVSLQVRTDAPHEITLSNDTINTGFFTTNVTVDGNPFKNALVSIWDGVNQPFSGLTDASGNVTITHTLTSGASATLTVTGFNLNPIIKDVTVASPTALTIQDNLSNTVSVFPNPASNNITISIDYSVSGKFTIEIINLVGQIVYTEVIEKNNTVFTKDIDLSNITRGAYLMKYSNNGNIGYEKLILN